MNSLSNLSDSKFFTSLRSDTEEEKIKLCNAISAPDYSISDFVGKQISIAGVIAEEITITNEETGEISVAPRIIMLDTSGKSYSCVSVGIHRSLSRIFSIWGNPSEWEKPLTVEVQNVKISKTASTYNLVVVSDK